MTEFGVVYDAFLGKMLEDEWGNWTEAEVEQDLFGLLQAAISWFKFPRTSLEYTDEGFVNDLSNEEVQILATYMKCEWLNRTILLAKFNETLAQERKNALRLESYYYRSVNKASFPYSRLAQQQC